MILKMSVVVTGTPAPLFSSWLWRNMASPHWGLSVGVPLGSSPTAVGRWLLDYSCWWRCLASACTWCSYSPERIRSTAVINTTNQEEAEKRKEAAQVFAHMARKCLEPRSYLVSSVLHEPRDFRKLTSLSDLCCCRFEYEMPNTLAALVPCIMIFNTPCLPLPVSLT